MTKKEALFKGAVRELHAAGIYPGPTAINVKLGRNDIRLNNLNGREVIWRREIMAELGIAYRRAS